LTIGSATPPPAANTPPTVAITAPATGSTLAGKTAAYAATASDTGGAVAKVEMYVGTKLVDTKTAAPYSGTIDTTTLPNGTATLMAVATDNQGATSSTQRSVTVNNTVVSNTGGRSDPPAVGRRQPPPRCPRPTRRPWRRSSRSACTGSRARPRATALAASATARPPDSAWQQGYPMWYDSRDGECRGSIVHLAPGTDYAVEMGVGSSFSAGVEHQGPGRRASRSARPCRCRTGSTTLKITPGRHQGAYVLYTGPATIDVATAAAYSIEGLGPST
jgi:hypothetical protein